ncbi:membrane protein [Bordetella pertussis]|nr:membrane protein [Bordetella pertussis]
MLAPNGRAFRQAVLIQYPRAGSWTIAFLTGTPSGEVASYLPGEHLSVYVPTTPNPTSGFFLMMPRDQVIDLQMSVDAALKYIVSMGVVAPADRRPVSPPTTPGAPWRRAPNRNLLRLHSLYTELSRMRTCYTGQVCRDHLGQTVTLYGW